MNCKYIEENIINYIEGRISQENRTGIEEHIIECDRCRKLMEETTAIWDSITSPVKSELSPFFWTRLQARIEEYEKPSKLPLLENFIKYLKPAAVGFTLLAGILFGYKIGETYVKKEMSIYQDELDKNVYFRVFEELPEGSIGETYANLHKEL